VKKAPGLFQKKESEVKKEECNESQALQEPLLATEVIHYWLDKKEPGIDQPDERGPAMLSSSERVQIHSLA
jgi:hypothetical protein